MSIKKVKSSKKNGKLNSLNFKLKYNGNEMTIEYNIKDKNSEEVLENIERCRYIKKDNNNIYVVNEDFFRKKVPDVWRYDIYRVNGQNQYESDLYSNDCNPYFNNRFGDDNCDHADISPVKCILIIESPHEHEFDENFEPIGPAMKNTGDNIDNYFMCKFQYYILPKLINKCKENNHDLPNKISVIISNPVQLQASLNYIHKNGIDKSVRNNVWNFLFEKGQKEKFLVRMKDYLGGENLQIIVNACTRSKSGNNKTCFVQVRDAIRTLLNETKNKNIIYFETESHPSAWHNQGITFENLRQSQPQTQQEQESE